jgi:hypothetical protein
VVGCSLQDFAGQFFFSKAQQQAMITAPQRFTQRVFFDCRFARCNNFFHTTVRCFDFNESVVVFFFFFLWFTISIPSKKEKKKKIEILEPAFLRVVRVFHGQTQNGLRTSNVFLRVEFMLRSSSKEKKSNQQMFFFCFLVLCVLQNEFIVVGKDTDNPLVVDALSGVGKRRNEEHESLVVKRIVLEKKVNKIEKTGLTVVSVSLVSCLIFFSTSPSLSPSLPFSPSSEFAITALMSLNIRSINCTSCSSLAPIDSMCFRYLFFFF